MTIKQIQNKLKTEEYNFLRENKNLTNLVLLTLGGSYAYGLNKEGSDLDVRGVALNSKQEILLGEDFEQVTNQETDTTIYSFNKILTLLTSCNPNTIEMLGLKPEHYLYTSSIGQELLSNRKLFLSKICIHTFGGYASSQLRRLENKSARLVNQAEQEAHILKSIHNAQYDFKHRYYPMLDSSIELYLDHSIQSNFQKEIFMDVNLNHYPLRDWLGMWNEMKSITSSYQKIGKRNENAISHDKLGKHMAHLIRLYAMGIDILEKEEIITYREEEHDLLMNIREGRYLDNNRKPISAFYDLLDQYEKRFEYAKNNTSLPEIPNYSKIKEFKMYVNEQVVRGVL